MSVYERTQGQGRVGLVRNLLGIDLGNLEGKEQQQTRQDLGTLLFLMGTIYLLTESAQKMGTRRKLEKDGCAQCTPFLYIVSPLQEQ